MRPGILQRCVADRHPLGANFILINMLCLDIEQAGVPDDAVNRQAGLILMVQEQGMLISMTGRQRLTLSFIAIDLLTS